MLNQTILQLLTAHSAWAPALTALLIGVDTFIGILKAFAKGGFTWAQLPQFVERKVLPYIGGVVLMAVVQYITAQAGGWVNTSVQVLFFGVVAAVNLALLADILGKLGIPVPAAKPPTTAK
jgi:hypothetical protein